MLTRRVLPRAEQHLPESLELLRRLAGGGRVADIDLDRLRPGRPAGVGHIEPDRDRPALGMRRDGQMAEPEGGVRQPVAEGEQRLGARGVVPPVADLRALGEGDLGAVTRVLRRALRPRALGLVDREGDGQLAGRVDVAEEQGRERGAVLLARVPGLHDRPDLTEPRHAHRAGRVEHHDRVRVDGGHGLDQRVRGRVDPDAVQVGALALAVPGEHHRGVGGPGRGDGLVEQRGGVLPA